MPTPTITVSAPTGSGSYVQGGYVTVNWTASPAVSIGEFGVFATGVDGQNYQGYGKNADGRETAYSVDMSLAVPAGIGYRATVMYRPTIGSGEWYSGDGNNVSSGIFAVMSAPTMNVVAPAGSGSYAQGSLVTVNWTASPAVSIGEFGVFATGVDGQNYQGYGKNADGRETAYSVDMSLAVPAGIGYRATVMYRPTIGSGEWYSGDGNNVSPGTFAVTRAVNFDGLDLNDRSLYFLMPGFDPGESEVTFDEFASYAGGVGVANVQPAHVVQLMLPIDVRGDDEVEMLAGVASINFLIAACSYAVPLTLTVGLREYSIIASTQIRPVRDELYEVNVARLAIVLNRLP